MKIKHFIDGFTSISNLNGDVRIKDPIELKIDLSKNLQTKSLEKISHYMRKNMEKELVKKYTSE